MTTTLSSEPRPNHWHRPDRMKACVTCGETFGLEGFYSYPYTTNQGKRSTRYESRCIECSKERRKAQSRAKPGLDAARSRARREAKPDWYPAYNKRRQECPVVRSQKAFHQRLRKARIRAAVGGTERDPHIRAIYAEAMRIEQIVACCPVFDTPILTKKMHVDHIIPLVKGGRHEIGNLQILPAGLNMRKGASCPRSARAGT